MSTSSIQPAPPATADSPPSARRGLRWWLRLIEVRLRFVVIVLVLLAVVTQWQRLSATWDGLWHQWRSEPVLSAVSGDLEFFCPMDPGVVSVWPAICPICNMDLVQRKKHDAQLLPEGVVARMQLSPYRVQLGGIRTAVVESRECVIEIPVSGVLTAVMASGIREGNAPDDGLHFTAPISRMDEALLAQPRTALVRAAGNASESFNATAELVAETSATAASEHGDVPSVAVSMDDSTTLTAGLPVTAVIRVPLGEAGKPATGDPQPLPVVPESAVVDHGFQQLVFIESMPGTFDAIPVALGRRCGEFFPVIRGVKTGDRVATVGAFLIDAEARLNPSLAITYFGANAQTAPARTPQVRVAKSAAAALSQADLKLVEIQKICPVTELPLDSMGGPVPVEVAGRRVFICCKGCEQRLKSDPEAYLAKIPAP